MTKPAQAHPRLARQLAYIDAAHRGYARVEDAIRTGKDCGLGRFLSVTSHNSAWLAASLTAAALLSCCGSSPWTATSLAPNQDPALPDPARRRKSWSAAEADGG